VVECVSEWEGDVWDMVAGTGNFSKVNVQRCCGVDVVAEYRDLVAGPNKPTPEVTCSYY